MSDENNTGNLNIQLFCEVPNENLEGLSSLLNWIFSSLIPLPRLLRHIWIIPAGELQEYVNQIISTVDAEANPHTFGPFTPQGVAIPVEAESGATAFVLIDINSILQLSPDNFFVLDVLSTILEEILHTHIYSLDWLRRGFLRYSRQNYGCKTDLFSQCSAFHDEYAVCRLKGKLFYDNLMSEDKNGQTEPVQLSYGSSLCTSIETAAQDLKQVVIGAASGSISIHDGWMKTITVVYRGILEPLSRNTGFLAAVPTGHHPFNDAGDSPFYQSYIGSHWHGLAEQLDRSFRSEFSEKEAAITEMVEILLSLLNMFGIHIRDTDDGGCWVDFRSEFFDAL